MRKDNRPYTLVRVLGAFSDWYARRFLHPQFESIGCGADFRKPTCFEVVGPRISVGDYFHAMATKDGRIRLVTWPETDGQIEIGDYVALSPGVRVKSATSVKIGDACVIAESVYITDADWHGIYERIYPPGDMAPVVIGNNVWISDRATVLKGVTIGDNSIVAAGAIVTSDVPPDTVVGGIPARPIRRLDPNARYATRADMFASTDAYDDLKEGLEKRFLGPNRWWNWLRSLLSPSLRD